MTGKIKGAGPHSSEKSAKAKKQKVTKAKETKKPKDGMVQIPKKRALKEEKKVEKPAANRKRPAAALIPNGDSFTQSNGTRSSKRARLQIIPYQSPESISTIIRITSCITGSGPPQASLQPTPMATPPVSKAAKIKSTPVDSTITTAQPKKKKATKTAVEPATAPTAADAPAKKKTATKKPPQVKANKSVSKGKATLKMIMKGKISNPTVVKKTKKALASKKTAATADSSVADTNTKAPSISVPLKKRALKKNAAQTQVPMVADTAQPPSIPSSAKTLKKKKGVGKNRLEGKPFVTEYLQDPTFESELPIPQISTLANSRLLIRAVILHDNKLLESLIRDKKSICAFTVPRSLKVSRDAFSYALERQNLEALKLLLNEKLAENLAAFPAVLVGQERTGFNSAMMLGHNVRNVCVGRGGKEGNNALLKDKDLYNSYNSMTYVSGNVIQEAFERAVPLTFLHKLSKIKPDNEMNIRREILYNIVHAVRAGNNQMAGILVQEAIEKDGFGFNLLHKEALLNTKEPFSPFKTVSIVKKSSYNDRITPIHCAAVNPNPEYLTTLLNGRPDYNILDFQNWAPIHYAACCTGKGPLTLLLSRGISPYLINREGETPLHVAAARNREENVKLLLATENNNDSVEEENPKDISGSLVQRVTKHGKTALMIACEKGHVAIAKLLLSAGADAGKFTPAKSDKLTAFMMAAIEGHLDVVKALVEFEVKVDAVDLKGRTAMAHAVINGQAHVVSYLLRLGSKHLLKDTSGNTLVHYAAAYGWYFCLELLLEAGCPPNEPNDWKMTPLAIAFMKGHIGLVQYLLSKPGVGINSRIDDSSGVTLLLQTINSNATSEFCSRLRFLIVEQSVDCNITDFEKNNALHYLVITESNERSRHTEYDGKNNYETSEARKYIAQAAKLLWDHKCDPSAINDKKESPVSLAIKKACFHLLDKFLDLQCPLPDEIDDEGNTLLHLLVDQATLPQAEIFYKRCGKSSEKVQIMKQMAKVYNKEGYTPLLWLFQRVTHVADTEDDIKRIVEFVSFLVVTLESDVNAVDRKLKSQQSVLHLNTQTNYGVEAMKIILPRRPNLEPLNFKMKTPLAVAISSGKERAAKTLLNAGANVNFKLENGESLLLLQAMNQTQSFNMIPLMIEKGANIYDVNKHTKNSILHYIARKPTLPFATESVKKLIQKGIDVNAVNKDGRTAMHLVVNFRGGETDTSYDMEDLLIASGAKLNVRDVRHRTPLHMVFVKIGKHSDSTFMDPIELVTTLVRAMKDTLPNFSEEIKAADEFGYTPLAYAAFRGATISCSYLMMEMAGNIDIMDKNGNTPFGLAVLNGHEGCSLQLFQQQGASFTNILNTCLTPKNSENEGTKEKPWKWKYIKLKDDENEKKEMERQKYPILQEVVRKDWQGILYLILEKLTNSGAGASTAISAAINTNRLKLAAKLVNRARPNELAVKGGETLLHTLAKLKDAGSSDCDTLTKIVEVLIAKGVSHSALDRNQTTALVYASVNRNYNLCSLLGEKSIAVKQQTAFRFLDKFGRSPFTALFWNIDEKTVFSKELKLWAESLLAEGAQVNIGCRYPVTVNPFPAVRYLACETQVNFSSPKYSPLMMAVIAGNYSIVKWLLTLRNSNIVDVNYQDDDGRTALMHAVRLNDIKMVQLILNPKTYDYEKDTDPWKKKSSKFHYRNHLSLEIRDRKGWTVIDHLIASQDANYYYTNSNAILRILYSAGAPINAKSGDNITPLERAIRMKRVYLVDTMEELLGLSKDRRTKIPNVYTELFKIDDDESVSLPAITTFPTDCEQMTEKLIEDYKATVDEEEEDSSNLNVIKPDSLIATDVSKYKVIYDTELKTPFSCCLTKIDMYYGIHGLYNFYKMQLVKETRGKELILLFTRWGRVGDEGQYQKTPFVSEEEAIKEFKKIFRAKSGNSWEDQEKFTLLPKKYRLVNIEKNKTKRPNQVKIGFLKLKDPDNKDSDLSPSVLKFVKNISLAHQSHGKFAGFASEYENNLPLGNLTYDTLKKGEALLDKIGELISKKDAVLAKGTGTAENQQTFMESVLQPSEEYYSLIPVYGFQTEKLKPMFTQDDLREKQLAIYKLIHLEFASQLLLGAQFNLDKMNPFEYIYRCLNTRVQILEEGEEEAQLILQYIHNTSVSGAKPKVLRIFRIERAGEMARFKNCGVGNPWLLWHGTSTVNLLSILNRGLKVTPLEATISGDLFGKGIYFADMFSKSRGYCHESASDSSNFIFLSEVALGKIHPVKLTYNAEQKPMPANCHSLKTSDSNWQTDPAASLIWKGRTVPLGRPVENILPEDEDHGLDYNEYIVFKEEQVLLRYLIQFTD